VVFPLVLVLVGVTLLSVLEPEGSAERIIWRVEEDEGANEEDPAISTLSVVGELEVTPISEDVSTVFSGSDRWLISSRSWSFIFWFPSNIDSTASCNLARLVSASAAE
jgi:hypothetical protein